MTSKRARSVRKDEGFYTVLLLWIIVIGAGLAGGAAAIVGELSK